jgi:hypothetical protein
MNGSIALHCDTYIQRLLRSHGWSHPTDQEHQAAPREPLTSSCVKDFYKVTGPDEGVPDALALAHKQGLGYCTLLGELLYAYTTCRPDI